MPHLISLLFEHLPPNFLLIKEHEGQHFYKYQADYFYVPIGTNKSAISKNFRLLVNPCVFIKSGFPPRYFNEVRMKAIVKRMKILEIKGIFSDKELRQKNFKI